MGTTTNRMIFSCRNFYLFLAVARQVLLSLAVEVPPPDGSACWSSTFGILQNEIGAALNPTSDLSIERKYVFCTDTVYKIASLNPATGAVPNATLGEQWPLLLFTPNVHLYCPGNCVLEMIAEPTNVIFAATTAIVASSGLVPQGLSAPPSNIENLIIDGFTIRNIDDTIYDDTNGVITFGPPGRNLVVKNCDFNSVGLAGWAIASEYYAAEAMLQPEAIPYQSLTIQDCTFSDSAFDRAAIIAFAVDQAPPSTDFPTNILTLERLSFRSNSNTGTTFGGGWQGLLSMEDIAQVTARDLCFVDNATPNGTIIEVRNPDSVIGTDTIYSVGTSSLGDEGECLGNILMAGCSCVEAEATNCFSSTPIERCTRRLRH